MRLSEPLRALPCTESFGKKPLVLIWFMQLLLQLMMLFGNASLTVLVLLIEPQVKNFCHDLVCKVLNVYLRPLTHISRVSTPFDQRISMTIQWLFQLFIEIVTRAGLGLKFSPEDIWPMSSPLMFFCWGYGFKLE